MKKNNAQRPAHIMIVDDDRLVLAALSRGLKDAGYRISTAANGEDACAIADRDPPDLALLDVRMPGMSGIALGRRLRERVPFLYLSAYGDEDTVRDGVAQGALGYLVKPLDIAQILPAVQAALARAAEIRALHEKQTQLSAALATNREIAMAVGLLMQRDGLEREQAFELLRGQARSSRRSMLELARELLAGGGQKTLI
jgi:two-component system, response regulator PdtaR